MTLNEVAEIVDEIDEIALCEGETLTLITCGGSNVQNVVLEATLWCSEDDEREQDDEGNIMESLEEFLLRRLEEHANHVLATVKRIRNPLPGDKEAK